MLKSHQQIPHTVQHTMSGESTPILCGTIPAFEVFMTTWEKAANTHPNLKKYIKPGLDWAIMYYDRMDLTGAYIITMHKFLWSSCPDTLANCQI